MSSAALKPDPLWDTLLLLPADPPPLLNPAFQPELSPCCFPGGPWRRGGWGSLLGQCRQQEGRTRDRKSLQGAIGMGGAGVRPGGRWASSSETQTQWCSPEGTGTCGVGDGNPMSGRTAWCHMGRQLGSLAFCRERLLLFLSINFAEREIRSHAVVCTFSERNRKMLRSLCSPSHEHTHMSTLTVTNTCVHTLTQGSHVHTHTCTHAQAHFHMHSQMYAYLHTFIHSYGYMHTLTHIAMLILMYIHMLTQHGHRLTHSHACTLQPPSRHVSLP